MDLDTFITIVSLIGAVVCWIGHCCFRENVYLKYQK